MHHVRNALERANKVIDGKVNITDRLVRSAGPTESARYILNTDHDRIIIVCGVHQESHSQLYQDGVTKPEILIGLLNEWGDFDVDAVVARTSSALTAEDEGRADMTPDDVRRSITSSGALLITDNHVAMPREQAVRVMQRAEKYLEIKQQQEQQNKEFDPTQENESQTNGRTNHSSDADADPASHPKDTTDEQHDDPELPPGTEWVGSHPAPAAGDSHHGRPPLGYDYINGALQPGSEYPEVRAALVELDDGEVTTSDVLEHIDTSATTVQRILNDPERRERYALDVRVESENGSDEYRLTTASAAP